VRKHQFVKTDCNCTRKATHFECKFCGTREYRSAHELTRLTRAQAECESRNAPDAPPKEAFKAALGGTFDCLSPDFETYNQGTGRCENC